MDVCGCRRKLRNERMRTTDMGSPITRTETWTIRYIAIYCTWSLDEAIRGDDAYSGVITYMFMCAITVPTWCSPRENDRRQSPSGEERTDALHDC